MFVTRNADCGLATGASSAFFGVIGVESAWILAIARSGRTWPPLVNSV